MKSTYNKFMVLFQEISHCIEGDQTLTTAKELITIARLLKAELGDAEKAAQKLLDGVKTEDERKQHEEKQKITQELSAQVITLDITKEQTKAIKEGLEGLKMDKLERKDTAYLCLLDEIKDEITNEVK